MLLFVGLGWWGVIETFAMTCWTGTEAFAASFDQHCMHYWILATHKARQHCQRLVLSTDDYGRYLLVERLKLPFTEVRTDLNAVPSRLSFLYAIGKVHTYAALAAEGWPFLHLDHDVFLWRRPASELLAADAVAQHEFAIRPELAGFSARLQPDRPRPTRTICSGILGGCDVTGLAAYAAESLALVNDPANEPLLRAGCRPPVPWLASCAVEEALFATHFAGRIAGFLPPRMDCTEAEWHRAGITHLNGTLKADPIRRLQAETRVALDHAAHRALAAELWWGELSLQAV